jgi:magnesium transporter
MALVDHQQNRELALDQLKAYLLNRNYRRAANFFEELHTGDQVEIFDLLEENERVELLKHLDVNATAVLFSHQEDDETLQAAESLSIDKLADVLDEMEPDEAADLLGDLSPEQAAEALEQMEDTEDVLQLLEYPDQTAGGRMTTDYVAVPINQTAAEAIDILRYLEPDHEVPYYIFVTDEKGVLVGVLGLRELVVSPPATRIDSIMDPSVIHATAMMDQEEVAQLMSIYDLPALPVVDTNKVLIGVITHDDILDVIQEEATEDILRLANVTDADLEPDSPVQEQLKGRLPWLFLNMFTALFASWVISNFEGLIGQVAVLAVFQSVVAGQGGNAASQGVAMFVRAMALGNIPPGKTLPLLFRQMIVGLLQGVLVGILVGIGVYIWKGNAYLGLVLGLSLVGNLILAGIVGTLIPMGLKAIGQDPAMASSVLVTAITDSLGFFIFLSLAQIFIKNLI